MSLLLVPVFVHSDVYLLCRRTICRQSVAVGELAGGAHVYYVLTVTELVSISCLYVLVVRSLDLCKRNGRFKIKRQRFTFASFIRNLHVKL